ncbi:MAG: hypothetical protein GX225_07785 [Clostridiales bacterium]|nr:hypothetical protein [Clostridiales bacterium]
MRSYAKNLIIITYDSIRFSLTVGGCVVKIVIGFQMNLITNRKKDYYEPTI